MLGIHTVETSIFIYINFRWIETRDFPGLLLGVYVYEPSKKVVFFLVSLIL